MASFRARRPTGAFLRFPFDSLMGPRSLTRVIIRSSWAERESVLVEAREADLLVFRRWAEFHREALGFMPSWNSHAGVSARFALIGAASRIRFEGRGYDTISVLTQYLTRRYGFTAMCTRRSDGIIEATLTRRSPGLARPMEPGQVPATLTLAEDERFTAVTRADAFAACRKRIVELDGEILSEIPTGEDND